MNFRIGLGVIFLLILFVVTGNFFVAIVGFFIGSYLDKRHLPNDKKNKELTTELLQHFNYLLGHLLRLTNKDTKENIDLVTLHFVNNFSPIGERSVLEQIASTSINDGINGTKSLHEVTSRLKVIYSYHMKVSREHFVMYLFAIFASIFKRSGERVPKIAIDEVVTIGNGLGIPTQIIYMMLLQSGAEDIFDFFAKNGSFYSSGSNGQSYSDHGFGYQRTNELKKAYEILGCDENVTKSELRKLKRNLMMQWHPDKAPPGKEKEYNEKFQEVNWAFDIISDHKGFS